MKRSLKLIMAALSALVVPALGWAAVTSSFGVNFYYTGDGYTGDEEHVATSTGVGFAKGDYTAPAKWWDLPASAGDAANLAHDTATYRIFWSANGAWNSGTDKSTDTLKLLYGYLDDVANSGRTKATVAIKGLPEDKKYAVALILSGDGNGEADYNNRYSPVLINGETYAYNGTDLLTGDAAAAVTYWGNRAATVSAAGALTEGTNVMFVEGLSGAVLSISSAMDAWNTSRLTIAGVQVWITDETVTATPPTDKSEIVSINFAGDSNGGSVAEDATIGLVSAGGWNNLPDGSGSAALKMWDGTAASDSTVVATYSSNNPYGYAKKVSIEDTSVYLAGYLDDGGNQASVSVVGIPFSEYSVIVYTATDSASRNFKPVQINGTWYAGTSVATPSGYATPVIDEAKKFGTWGTTLGTKAVYGTNALRVDGLAGTLTIKGGTNDTNARGGIAAIQIVNTGTVQDDQEIDWTEKGATVVKTSELLEITSSVVKLKLADGATLEVDAARTISLLQLNVEGAVTVKGANEMFENIDRIDCANVTGTATLEVASLLDGTIAKCSGFDIIKKTGTAEDILLSTTGLTGAQLIVEAGTVNVDINFTAILATEANPLTVTGEGSKINFIGTNHQQNRMPAGGYIKAENGATVTLKGVNLFNGDNPPKVVLDNATLLTEATSGGHIKIHSVTMKDSTVRLSRASNAYQYEGLFLIGDGAKISATSGTNTIAYRTDEEGTHANVLKIAPGTIEVVAGATLDVQVPVTTNGAAVTKTGDGALSWTPGASQDFVVSAGTLTLDTDVTLSGTITGGGTIAVDGCVADLSKATVAEYTGAFTLANSGTLILPAGKEGTIDVPAGSTLKLVLSESQAATNYSASGVTNNGTFAFLDTAGNTITNGVNGTEYVCPAPTWKPVDADSVFDDEACWTDSTKPTTGTIVIDTSAYEGDIAVTIPDGYTSVTVNGNATYLTTVRFADGVTTYPAIGVAGQVALPIAVVNTATLSVADNALLAAEVLADAEEALTKELSGNYTFGKSGAGTLVLDAAITPAKGTTVLAGTLKNGSAILGGSSYGTYGDITVCNGAAFDFNGKIDGFTRYVTLEEGATLKNGSDADIGKGNRQLHGIILNGDATIEAVGDFGLIAGGYGATPLTLNGYTLTKKGDGAFWLCKTTITDGTIAIEGGYLQFVNSAINSNGVETLISDIGNIVLDAKVDNGWRYENGTVNYNGTITKRGEKSLTIASPIGGQKTLTVEAGTLVLTAENTRYACATIIESGATLDLTTAGATLYNTNGDNYTGQDKLTIRGTLQVASDSAYGSFATRYDGTTLDGGTLEIAGDITCDRCFNTTEKGGSILVRDGVTYTINAYSGQEANWAFIFKVNIDGTLTKKGNGTLVLHTPVTGYKYKSGITSPDNASTEASSGGITVEAGTLTLNGANTYTGATTVAEGATIAGTGKIGGTLTFNAGATWDMTNGALEVTGAVTQADALTIMVPADAKVGTTLFEGAEGSSFNDKTITIADRDDVIAAVEGTIIKLAAAKTYTVEVTVGETTQQFETITEALAAVAANGGSIKLLADIALTGMVVVEKDVLLDLGGKKLTAGWTWSEDAPAAFWVKNGGELTLQNGTLDATVEAIRLGEKASKDETTAGTADIASTAVITTTDIGVLVYGGSTLTSAGTIMSTSTGYAAIQGNGLDTLESTITITGGMIVSDKNHAIYHPQPGTLTIGTEGATGIYPAISGVTGIEMRAGKLVMNSGTVTATGAYDAPDANSNGSTVEGAAIVLSQHVTSLAVTAEIKGGTITAENGKTFVVANTTVDPVDIKATIAADIITDLTTVDIAIVTLELKADETTGDYTLVEVENAAAWAALEELVAAEKLTQDEFDSIETIANPEVATVIVGCGATVEDGVATFNYEFKVSEITMDADGKVSVTVTLGTGQTFATDVVVTLVDLDGEKVGDVAADGTATITKEADTLLFKAKAAKKVQTNE